MNNLDNMFAAKSKDSCKAIAKSRRKHNKDINTKPVASAYQEWDGKNLTFPDGVSLPIPRKSKSLVEFDNLSVIADDIEIRKCSNDSAKSFDMEINFNSKKYLYQVDPVCPDILRHFENALFYRNKSQQMRELEHDFYNMMHRWVCFIGRRNAIFQDCDALHVNLTKSVSDFAQEAALRQIACLQFGE